MSERIIPYTGRRAMRRILNSKIGPKDHYKGSGSGAMGEHTKHGKYMVNPKYIRDWVVPDFSNFSLKPYVSQRTPKIQERPMTADSFLQNSGENTMPPRELLERPPIRIPNIAKRVANELVEKLIRKNGLDTNNNKI